MCLDEDRHAELRQFVRDVAKPLLTTDLCFAEALGVVKRKLVSERVLDNRAYFDAVNCLLSFRLNNLNINQVNANLPEVFEEVRRIGQKYPALDFSDALQLVTLTHGTYQHLGPRSASVLITADKRLRDAVRAEGRKVWYLGEPIPA